MTSVWIVVILFDFYEKIHFCFVELFMVLDPSFLFPVLLT
jgi:hypothetical protein